MQRRFLAMAGAVCVLGLAPLQMAMAADAANSVSVKVAATAMPWSLKANPNIPYGKGDGTAPAVAVGFKLVPGTDISMQATGSTTTVAGGGSFTPAGQAEFVTNKELGGSGTPFPSMYINPVFYPVVLNQLIGVFVDEKGKIVKSPFPVGNGLILTVPEGAKAVQFGINDDVFADNSGEIVVTVSLAPAP